MLSGAWGTGKIGTVMATRRAAAGHFRSYGRTLRARRRAADALSCTDALTGLRNRLVLDEVLDMAVGVPGSRWAEASAAFIDIDHFGASNKLHTDASGDDAVRAVAAAVRLHAPVAERVFCKAGEAFVVVLPGLAGAGRDDQRYR